MRFCSTASPVESPLPEKPDLVWDRPDLDDSIPARALGGYRDLAPRVFSRRRTISVIQTGA